MVRIYNSSQDLWEFGTLRCPPGESDHTDEAWVQALKTTSARQYIWPAWLHPSATLRFEIHHEAEVVVEEAQPALPEPYEPVDEAPHAGRDLKAHTRAELQEIASTLEVEFDPKDSKSRLINLIKARGSDA